VPRRPTRRSSGSQSATRSPTVSVHESSSCSSIPCAHRRSQFNVPASLSSFSGAAGFAYPGGMAISDVGQRGEPLVERRSPQPTPESKHANQAESRVAEENEDADFAASVGLPESQFEAREPEPEERRVDDSTGDPSGLLARSGVTHSYRLRIEDESQSDEHRAPNECGPRHVERRHSSVLPDDGNRDA
jgi:hypothetical protein